MKQTKTGDDSLWQKTQYANLVRYKPSNAYFARIRMGGKLIRRTLKTKVLSVAKLRLGDLEKKERQLAEHQVAVADGSITVDDALATYRQRLEGDASIKPRTREYHQQRITALFKSWPELKRTEVRSVTKTDCLNWAARLARTPVQQCSITYTEGPGSREGFLWPAQGLAEVNARFTSSAEAELQEAIAFYEAAENGLGRDGSNPCCEERGGAQADRTNSILVGADVRRLKSLRKSSGGYSLLTSTSTFERAFRRRLVKPDGISLL